MGRFQISVNEYSLEMPAPSPYTPPQPSEPPNRPTPRISRARRLSTPARGSFSSPPHSPVSSARAQEPTAHFTVSRRLLPDTSSAPRFPSPTPPEEAVHPTLDEDLEDPDHFIRIFSAINGPIFHLNTELYEKLERYLVKVNRYHEDILFMPGTSRDRRGGVSNVNFAEAALVVQGSTRIYGKKVDLLFDAAIQLFRLLSAPFEELAEEGEDEGDTSSTPRTPRGTKRPRLGLENRDLAEDILSVDNFREGRRIEQRRVARPKFSELVKNLSIMPPRGHVKFLPPNIPRLVRKTKALGTNDEEAERINSRRVPQFGQGMESRGFIDEYRLNEVIRKPDSMLVDHFILLEQEPNSTRAVEDPPVNKGGSQIPLSQCDSGIDSCPSSVYNPVESIGAHEVDSIIWEGGSVGACGETDTLSFADDGFVSEGAHEEGVSELEEESEIEVNKVGASELSENETGEGVVETEAVNEQERSGTESSGIYSELGPTDQDSQATNTTEDEREPVGEATAHDGEEPSVYVGGEPDSVNSSASPKTSPSELKEVDFTPTPRRNKRKMKNFKLPCKLSLLLPEKKKRLSRGNKAAALWRPSQSPCSSSSSNYPQSPMSFPPASPDPHSLNLLLLQDEDPNDHLDNMSESDNEGEYFDPPSDGQPQINYWIHNHQKDLMSAGKENTLSDQVAQWQELIVPRLDANLEHGPYSHVRYAPILVELVARNGWPPPQLTSNMPATSSVDYSSEDDTINLTDSEDDLNFPLDWNNRSTENTSFTSLEESHCVTFIPSDSDFVDPRECDDEWGGENFFGFKSVKQIKRRGIVLLPDSVEEQGHSRSLFSVLSNAYNWGLKDHEAQLLEHEKQRNQWLSSKRQWLQGKVKAGISSRRNWEEWVEEDGNVESNCTLDMLAMHNNGHSSSHSAEPVQFTTVCSGLRKEEVSRLLFTALHLASQGHMEISSVPGEINSMQLSLHKDASR